eukprot:6196884-Pleurochrysis_carterae.AAC.2
MIVHGATSFYEWAPWASDVVKIFLRLRLHSFEGGGVLDVRKECVAFRRLASIALLELHFSDGHELCRSANDK